MNIILTSNTAMRILPNPAQGGSQECRPQVSERAPTSEAWRRFEMQMRLALAPLEKRAPAIQTATVDARGSPGGRQAPGKLAEKQRRARRQPEGGREGKQRGCYYSYWRRSLDNCNLWRRIDRSSRSESERSSANERASQHREHQHNNTLAQFESNSYGRAAGRGSGGADAPPVTILPRSGDRPREMRATTSSSGKFILCVARGSGMCAVER